MRLATKTLPETIADQLRRDILSGHFAPGSPLKERETALEMHVSRTPMREAIRILAEEGLVILRPARSPLVADPSLREITDAIDVLRVLEVLSGDLACARATAEDLSGIRMIHEEMTRAYDRLDPLELFEIDTYFHVSVVQAAHNSTLSGTHKAYLERLWRVRYLSVNQRRSRGRVLRQHGEILAGIDARDPERVKGAITAHLEALVENIRFKFEQDTAPA
jgi:GntR family transcriptional regulator, rspAB operon transcriptional repressor